MRARVAVLLLAGGIVGLGLLRWHADVQQSRASDTVAVAPTDAALDPTPRREISSTRPPAAASAASTRLIVAPSPTPRRPMDERALPATAARTAREPPRQPLRMLDAPAPATGEPPRPTEALQAVAPQPLPPVSRIPLTASAVGPGR